MPRITVLLAIVLSGTACRDALPPTLPDASMVVLGEYDMEPLGLTVAEVGPVAGPDGSILALVGDGIARRRDWPPYHMVELDDFGVQSPLQINDRGQVSGWRLDDTGLHAFLWNGWRTVDLGSLGGGESAAMAISNWGQVVGWSSLANGERHAFLWSNGTMRDLGTLGGSGSGATDINDMGQVVGWASQADGTTRAFLWRDGLMTDLGSRFNYSYAYAVSERGHVVGTTTVPYDQVFRSHAALWYRGTLTDLGALDATNEQAHAIDVNDDGVVVGLSRPPVGQYHGFKWEDGLLTDLGALPGHRTSVVVRINWSGQIAGTSYPFDNDGPGSGIIWEGGAIRAIGTSPAPSTRVNDMNDRGQVVGMSPVTPPGSAEKYYHAFVWANGSMVDLGSHGRHSVALAINSRGDIVGWSQDATEPVWHLVMWRRPAFLADL